VSTREVAAPYFPIPPQAYDQNYFSEVIRSFSIFLSQSQNPGTAVFNTLNLLNLPIYADNASALTGGLSVNDVYKTSNGELRIVL